MPRPRRFRDVLIAYLKARDPLGQFPNVPNFVLWGVIVAAFFTLLVFIARNPHWLS